MARNFSLRTGTALAALVALGLPASAQQHSWGERNTDLQPVSEDQFRAELVESVAVAHEVIAPNLEHPWGIAVLPGDAGYLVTERPGRLRHVARDGQVSPPIRGVPEVWGSVYDIRCLLDATVKLRDGRKITDMEMPLVGKLAMKEALKKIEGTEVEKLLKEYNVI